MNRKRFKWFTYTCLKACLYFCVNILNVRAQDFVLYSAGLVSAGFKITAFEEVEMV